MKKLLIIQIDEAYFLFETIQVLEKYIHQLKDFELTVLVDKKAMGTVFNNTTPLINGITTDQTVLQNQYDISVNFSLNEAAWELHASVSSDKKLGPYRGEDSIWVNDLWSSYLMTLKSKAPFLTFHLQDVYKNILGIKGITLQKETKTSIRQIALAPTHTKIFFAEEQENLIHELSLSYPNFPLKDLSEIDLVSDVSHTLYIGPASLDALKFCGAGGKGIFLTSAFQGFNLLPYSGEHKILSCRHSVFKASTLLSFIEDEIAGKSHTDTPYSVYEIDHENVFGSYLKSLNHSDDNYPFYQSHVVLWNFLLNLFDTNLEVTKCSDTQLNLLKSQHEVLTKFIRLHDYAMSSIDTIYHESKAQQADASKIDGHIKTLIEIERVGEQLAQSHSLLKPVLDFYRIRRGQNTGESLHEQSQISFMTYSEEHQALQALEELFSVTLRKNEVNI